MPNTDIISAITVGSTTYEIRDNTKLTKYSNTTSKNQMYVKAANGSQIMVDMPVANSTGKDSVINTTTDDDVSRANIAGGAYSVAFGSRNVIGSSASESGAFGGDIHINAENTYGFGYHVWAHSNQNLLGGYDIGSNAKESLIFGNTIGVDCTHNSSTHTWTANSTAESDKSKYLMVFGDHHTVGSKALSNLIVGSTHTIGNSFQYSILSGYKNTIGNNVEYVNVFGGSDNKIGENGEGISDCTIFGYKNTLYGGTYTSGSDTNKIDNVYIMGSHNANSKNTTSSNFKHSVWMFGHYLAPVENGQFIIGEYNKTSSNDHPNAYFLVGTGDSSTRRTSFAVCYNSTYGSHMYLGNVRIAESGSNITVNGTAVSLSGHTHSASNITSGTFAIARIPTGSSSTTSSSYVVKCNDSRLSDARPASDVSAWAKESTKPSYTLDEVDDGTTRKLSDYALATHNHDSSYVAKNTAITGATKCKITYDSKGLVTSGADLEASDIPSLSADKITSGTFAIARIPTGTSATTVALGDHTHDTRYVRYDASTSLTDAQKAQARSNIGAGTYSKPSDGIPDEDLEESYLEISDVAIKAVYGTRPDEIHGTTAEQVMYTIGTSSGNIVQRTTNGQIVLPNQSTYAPGDDHAISKRWVVAQGYTTNTGTVIGSGLTADCIVLGNGTVNVKISTYKPSSSSTTWSTSSDEYLPTMKAISSYVSGVLPPTITISTGNTKSVSDGTNTLTFGTNAFNSNGYVRYDTSSQGLTTTQKSNARTNIGAQAALPTTSTAGKVLKSTSTSGEVEWGDAGGGATLYRHNLEWVVKTGSSPNYDYIHFYGYIITNSSTAYTASSYFGSITTLFKKTVLTGGFMDASDADHYSGIETHWLPSFNKNNNINGVYINYRCVGDYDTYNVLFYTTTSPYAFTDHVEPNCDLS